MTTPFLSINFIIKRFKITIFLQVKITYKKRCQIGPYFTNHYLEFQKYRLLLERCLSKLPFCMYSWTRRNLASSKQYPKNLTRLGWLSFPQNSTSNCTHKPIINIEQYSLVRVRLQYYYVSAIDSDQLKKISSYQFQIGFDFHLLFSLSNDYCTWHIISKYGLTFR